MTRQITLRRAGWRDLSRLYRWRNDAETRAMMRGTAPIGRLEHLAWWLRLCQRSRQSPVAARQFVAEDEVGAPIGAGRLDIVGVVADFDLLVAPDARGRGYGTALIGALVEEAAALGCRRCTAVVRVENLGSRRAFLRNRFTLIGSADGYFVLERAC
jgi:RimJ/RimL family protein N-acetyltransferase